MKKEQLERINELAHKKKSVGLTDEELKEQKNLYHLFIKDIKGQVTTQLDEAGFNKKSDN